MSVSQHESASRTFVDVVYLGHVVLQGLVFVEGQRALRTMEVPDVQVVLLVQRQLQIEIIGESETKARARGQYKVACLFCI